jgi:nucleotide-binding universal stress UspA family protein
VGARIGSITQHVVALARCPVVVIPTAELPDE